jgi:hypothetical protein
MTLGWASANTTVNDDDEFYTFVDGEKFLDGGPFSSVKFGLKYHRPRPRRGADLRPASRAVRGHGLRRPQLLAGRRRQAA